jgi:putative peptide zinc metalloprotease protein
MAEPAKIQLLTRKPGETTFQLHEIESSQAHLSYRPQRVPKEIWEITPQPPSPDGRRNVILKNLQRDRYLLLDSHESFLWDLFDGSHSLDEIARSFHLQFGAFDFAIIRRLLAKLYQAGLLVERENLALQQSLARSQAKFWAMGLAKVTKCWRQLSFTVPNADRICAILYRRGGFLLFHPVTLGLTIILALLAGTAAIHLSFHAKQFTQLLSARPWLSTGIMLVSLLLVSIMHVTVHALACKAYNRRVREVGFFLLQGVLPTFYADVTDIFMSTRRARVIVDLAGPLVELFFGSVAFLAAYHTDLGVVQALLFGIGVLLWEGALINLYPFNFLELDGYNIVADLLAMPTLRQQALALAPQLHRRLLQPRTLTKAEWIQIAYLSLCVVSVLIYLIAHLDFLDSLLPTWK